MMGSPYCTSVLVVLVAVLLSLSSHPSIFIDGQEHCPQRCRQPALSTGVRIAYLVIVHNNRTLYDASHLIRGIRDPRNLVLVHVDAKVKDKLLGQDPTILDELERSCPCLQALVIDSVHDVQWSHWSMNLPTLWGMKVAVEDFAGQWDVFINLSGDTLPVYTPSTLATMLSDLPYNFVTSSSCETGLLPSSVYIFPKWWHKRAHYTHQETEADPVLTYRYAGDDTWNEKSMTTYFGSQWMILQADFCHWLVEELEREDSQASLWRDYLMESEKLMTDETFIPSLIMQVDQFKGSLPKVDVDGYLLWKNGTSSPITDVRFERMDEHVPTAFGAFPVDQRYQVPTSSSVEQPRPWGPYFLGVYDLGRVIDTGALFVRKVSVEVEPNLVHLLPVDRRDQIPNIRWPVEVSISDKPDWEKRKAELMAKRLEEAEDDEEEEEL